MDQNYPIVRLAREPRTSTKFPGQKPRFPRKEEPGKQGERHGQKFEIIEGNLQRWEAGIEVSRDPAAVVPERVVVFETIGPVRDFARAARDAGFKWIAEQEGSLDEDDVEEGDDNDIGMGRMYLTIPTSEGLRRLLTYWRRYTAGRSADTPSSRAWWRLFGYLRDVRTWSAKDRVSPLLERYVRLRTEPDPTDPVRLEVDLWFQEDAAARDEAEDAIREIVRILGGQVHDCQTISEIAYQAALISLPPAVAASVARLEGPLASAQAIQRVLPQSYMSHDVHDAELTAAPDKDVPQEMDSRPAVAALLDGYPVQGHRYLTNRIDVEEVDIVGSQCPVNQRYHGTGMASLILHGDIARREESIDRVLKVVPVLVSSPGSDRETTPLDKLPLPLIYNAVVALMEGVHGGEALAPSVVLINHSMCDVEAPFAGTQSAWAKLIDYLSYRYRLLFILSAGNVEEPFLSNDFPDRQSFTAQGPVARQAAVINAFERAKGLRGMFSPAEAVNALTVGALHEDGGAEVPQNVIDPFPLMTMTSICSGLGLGFAQSVKPDLVEEGGRVYATVTDANPGIWIGLNRYAASGHEVAAPGPATSSGVHTRQMSGTSNAAALVTRSGIRLVDAVEHIFREDRVDWTTLSTRAVILKALLVHGSGWGSVGNVLEQVFPPAGRYAHYRRRAGIARFLGYGRPVVERVVSGDANRITLLADDTIKPKQLHEYRIPIPPEMIRSSEIRRVTVTLAWSSPIVATALYRDVGLEVVDVAGKSKFWQGLKSTLQVDGRMMRKGTLIHAVLEGANRTSFSDEGGLFVGVQARPAASGGLPDVPYALAITLEVGQPVNSRVYQWVRDQVKTRQQIRNARQRTR